jgi:hypothetical protein
MTDEKYYPELSDEGKQEAAKIVADFKEQIKKAADEAISTIETSTIMYIESDSWQNFRNHLMDGFKDYQNNKVIAKYDFKAIRQQILKDNYEEIVKDLNQDLLEEIQQLKLNIQSLQLILNSR